MDTIICKNIFVSSNETEKKEKFNEVWQLIVNLIENNK